MTTLIQQYLWVIPVAMTVLIWTVVVKLPYNVPEQEGGFECHPMFEITTRFTIVSAISIFVWLAFVTAALWVAKQ